MYGEAHCINPVLWAGNRGFEKVAPYAGTETTNVTCTYLSEVHGQDRRKCYILCNTLNQMTAFPTVGKGNTLQITSIYQPMLSQRKKHLQYN